MSSGSIHACAVLEHFGTARRGSMVGSFEGASRELGLPKMTAWKVLAALATDLRGLR
jgi:hypothetical protein